MYRYKYRYTYKYRYKYKHKCGYRYKCSYTFLLLHFSCHLCCCCCSDNSRDKNDQQQQLQHALTALLKASLRPKAAPAGGGLRRKGAD